MANRMMLGAAFVVAVLAGCSSSSAGTATNAQPTEPPPRTLRVKVVAGPKASAAQAPLTVAIYASCPPAGPPVDLKFKRIDAPKFPATAELEDVKPGEYHVLAYVGAAMQPSATDPQVCSPTAAKVTETAGAEIEVSLP